MAAMGTIKKPPKKPSSDKSTATWAKDNPRRPEECGEDGYAGRTQWDEPVFDFAAGQIPRGKAAQADADRRRRLQVTALLRVGNVEHVLRVDDDEELDQCRHGEEIGVADHGQPEDAIPADALYLGPQVGEKVDAELFRRVGGGHLRDAQAGEQAKSRQGHQHRTRPGLPSGERFAQPRAGDGPADDRDESAELKDAIAPGEPPLGQQFRQQAVFRGAENGAMHLHEENAADDQEELVGRKPGQRQ